MAATIYASPFLYNSLLSDLEIDILDVVCYQFEQYGGLDWENLASGLAFNMDSPLRDKVRLNQSEIDRADRHCSSMHEKLHILVNTFVLRCRMFDVNIDVEHSTSQHECIDQYVQFFVQRTAMSISSVDLSLVQSYLISERAVHVKGKA